MIIPYSTDAPIYHVPYATLGVIGLNVLLFMGLTEEQTLDYMLIYGTLQPLTWISSTFLHADFLHLLGNMIFLWSFGLVVEGKIGWWKFLVAYLVIALLAHAVEAGTMYAVRGGQPAPVMFEIDELETDLPPDDAEGGNLPALAANAPFAGPIGSLGASGAIFGLLACCLIWAPKNSFECFVWIFGPFPRLLPISISVFAGLFLGYEVLMAYFFSQGMSSEILHLLGAGSGALVGLVMLKREWVDCENWDLFSVWAGRNQLTRDQLAALQRKSPAAVEKTRQAREGALAQIEAIVAEGKPQLAWLAHQKMQAAHKEWQLPAPLFRRLISAFHAAQLHVESIPVMVEYLRLHSDEGPKVRLALAEILVTKEPRPAQALRVLEKIPAGALDEKLAARRQKIEQRAHHLRQQEDYVEFNAEDW